MAQQVADKFENRSISEVFKVLEKNSGYKFYYDPAQTDSVRITTEMNGTSLSDALAGLLNNTGLNYAIDTQRKVIFITKGYLIATEIRTGNATANESSKPLAGVPFFTDKPEAVAAKATLEYKLYEIGEKSNQTNSAGVSLAGYIHNITNGEAVSGVSVYEGSLKRGVATNQFGYYTITLPRGRHILSIKGAGIRETLRQISLNGNGRLDIEVQDQILALKEVVVSAEKSSAVSRTAMGVERLDIKTIKQVPTVFGEADILRVILTLPGVKSVGEASTGFNVRGGSADQNLILFNDATIYNPSHFFGFFSAFNPDAIKDVELYKSSIPAKFGGRLASVLDVSTREGNKKKFAGTAGLGLITSRLNFEGPLIKDKTSFIIGGRTTYSNWLLNLLPSNSGYKDAKASFHDINLNVNHEAGEKDNLYLTGYLSQDRSNLGTDTTFTYANRNISLKWKHVFTNKFYGIFTGGTDNYKYENFSNSKPVNAYQLNFDISQTNLKANFTWYPSARHTLDFGMGSIFYKLHPGSFIPTGSKSLIAENIVPPEQALESAVFLTDHFAISNVFALDYGLRYSIFNNIGPQQIFTYAANSPVTENNVIGIVSYAKGKAVKTYHGPEIRISGRAAITSDFSVKAGYNTLRQYIHVLSNTTAISPTDIWKLSDPNIKPQFGQQVSLGLYKNFRSGSIETSAEVYYKKIKDFLDYKSGAVLILNHTIERDVVSTKGKAYGIELMIKKMTGKLNGWLSYTYSRTLLKMGNPDAGLLINRGEYYPANYDKPHDMTLVGNYRFSHRFSTSLNVTYSTGRPITLPVAKFTYAGSQRIYYSDRNAYRIPDYFRTDFSLNIDGNHKTDQRFHNSWTMGIYNVSGRKNPYSTYYNTERGIVTGYKLTVFGSAIPFLNYNIRF